MPKTHKIIPGTRFNKLTAIRELEKHERKNKKRRSFLWQCDCGKKHKADLAPVIKGLTTSCGCYKLECNRSQLKGEKSPSWKGGVRKDDGYVFIYKPNHPNAKSNGYVREHTLVMSNYLKRSLIKGENVHHINGIKDDNRLENLELWSTSQPSGQRIKDKLVWAYEIIKLYSNYEKSDDRIL